jgi:rare lipoprotein A
MMPRASRRHIAVARTFKATLLNIEATMKILLVLMGLLFTLNVTAEEGTAAYYSDVLHGKKTASGEPYDKNAFTAAHKTLAFGTRVEVTNLENDESVTVIINDRGPFTKGRIIDLSRAAAEQIDMVEQGLAPVRLEILD